jgi:uncharacterized membrane protein
VVTPRTAFAISIALFAAVLAWSATVLPDRVPVHFGFSGAADRVVSRPRALLEVGLAGVFVAALLGGVATWVRRSMSLSTLNVPHKEYWTAAGREPRLRAMVADDTLVTGTATMLLFSGVLLATVSVADEPEPRLGVWAFGLIGGFVVFVVGYAVLARRRYRPPGSG